MGAVDQSDLDFIFRFENLGLAKSCWGHPSHVRMAWIQLSLATGFEDGLEKIRKGIQKFNAIVGEKAYHETVTVAFTKIIYYRMHKLPFTHSWRNFCSSNTDLFEKYPPFLNEYYSPEILDCTQSKKEFSPPDRKPLPEVEDDEMSRPYRVRTQLPNRAHFLTAPLRSFS